MIRRPTSTTLYPYTTIIRSMRRMGTQSISRRLRRLGCGSVSRRLTVAALICLAALHLHAQHKAYHETDQCCNSEPSAYRRSEEHTSELQSHLNIVCQLLLET